jgi:Virulence factor
VARYRVIRWRDIPSVVEASDESGTVRVPLSQRFQDLIDGVAMRLGATDSEAYLEGWTQDPEVDRVGGARGVADAVAAELEAGFGDYVKRSFG